MFRFFFQRASYILFSLFCITFLCSTILTFEAPSYLHNFLSKNSSPREIEKTKKLLGTPEKTLASSLELTLSTLFLRPGYSHFQRSFILGSIKNAFTVTASLMIPSLFLGILAALFFAFVSFLDFPVLSPLISFFLLSLGSLSDVVLILILKLLLCTKQGLHLFPLHGWDASGPLSYFKYASVPILIMTLSLLCLYGPLFYQILVSEKKAPYTRTLKAMGCPSQRIFFIYHLKTASAPILTHIARLTPSYIIGGSILVENHFNIPGLGFLTYESCVTGDKQTILMLISLTAFCYLLLQEVIQVTLTLLDKRTDL